MSDQTILRPATEDDLRKIVADALVDHRKLALRGSGSKDQVGRGSGKATIVDMTALSGVVDYDPAELVLSVRSGTRLTEIDELLQSNGQMLAFEPWDAAPLFGMPSGRTTIGGVVAAGLSGSQRLTQGAVRDHLLGFAAISGRAERFVGGAKVVKNVTGYDLPKLLAGSWGRLAAMTEVTLKVLPRPAASLTMVARGFTPRQAWQAMAKLLGSEAEVAAAAHLPPGALDRAPITAVRVQGFPPSVEARCRMIETIETDDVPFRRVDEEQASAIWAALRTVSPLGRAGPLWRVSLPARHGAAFLDVVDAAPDEWLMDWAGGLIWYSGHKPAAALRAEARKLGGHAMLLRDNAAAGVPALHPHEPTVSLIEERVRRAFDPGGVFETGRF